MTSKTSQCPNARSSWSFVVIFLVDQQQSSYQLVKLFLYCSWLSSQWPAKHQLPWSKTHLHKNIYDMASTICNTYYFIFCTIEAYGWCTKSSILAYATHSGRSEWSHWTVICIWLWQLLNGRAQFRDAITVRSVLGSFSVRTCCEYPRWFGSVSTGDGVCCSPHCAASFSTL